MTLIAIGLLLVILGTTVESSISPRDAFSYFLTLDMKSDADRFLVQNYVTKLEDLMRVQREVGVGTDLGDMIINTIEIHRGGGSATSLLQISELVHEYDAEIRGIVTDYLIGAVANDRDSKIHTIAQFHIRHAISQMTYLSHGEKDMILSDTLSYDLFLEYVRRAYIIETMMGRFIDGNITAEDVSFDALDRLEAVMGEEEEGAIHPDILKNLRTYREHVDSASTLIPGALDDIRSYWSLYLKKKERDA